METRVLVDGEWVTRRIGVQDVLRHHDAQDNNRTSRQPLTEKLPFKGILTQTVVQSPLVNHILPIRFRSLDHDDIAFVGEDFVQVKELRSDGLLWEIARKDKLGARICNARVVGSLDDYKADLDAIQCGNSFKIEEHEVDIYSEKSPKLVPAERLLPPQFLVLQLDTGDSVFLKLHQSHDDAWRIVITSRYRVMKPMLGTQPGMHLDVDPSSRYMAVGCSEAHFTVYELNKREELQNSYTQDREMSHVNSAAYIPVSGTIQSMVFLYPSPGLVVLLVLVIKRAKTKMLVYEWAEGSDVRNIKPLSIRGHLLPDEHQMPLLVIPLRFKTAFILVSDECMSYFVDILEGAPGSTVFYSRREPSTQHHHGKREPLWVAWSRPVRHDKYKSENDSIFIAREDGVLKYLEIDSEVEDFNDIDVGLFDARCGSTLACLSYDNPDPHLGGDLLLTNGDSCAGGCYLVVARKTQILVQPIENWTPVQDIVAVNRNSSIRMSQDGIKTSRQSLPKPDRLFACVGKGSKGVIAEFRHGMEARIGLHFDCEVPIIQAWSLPFDCVGKGPSDGTLFLLSVGSSSVALRLAGDEETVEAVSQDFLKVNLEQHTIAASVVGEYVIQVTELCVIVANRQRRLIFESNQLLHVQESGTTVGLGETLRHASILENVILYTTIIDKRTYLLALELSLQTDEDWDGQALQEGRTLAHFDVNVTTISSCTLQNTSVAILAESNPADGCSWLRFVSLSGTLSPGDVNIGALVNASYLIEVESIVAHPSGDKLMILCGLRNGRVLRMVIDTGKSAVTSWELLHISDGPLTARKDYEPNGQPIFSLTSDDGTAYIIEQRDFDKRKVHVHQMYCTDAANPGAAQIQVTSIAGTLTHNEFKALPRLLVVAGTQLVLTSLDTIARAVPRHFAIGGTPTRLLYSRRLDALVVAASVDDKSSILFIDPDTGEDMTRPLDGHRGKRVDHGARLGRLHDRIFRLLEWTFEKDNSCWHFIIACTDSGKLLIISTESAQVFRSGTDIDTKRKIYYHTKYMLKSTDSEPVYTVTGFPQGLLWCSGEKLFCDVLDLNEKKFRRVAEYELPSLARNMEYVDGEIYVLTSEHSLLVLHFLQEGDKYAIRHKTSDKLSRLSLDHATITTTSKDPHNNKIHLVSDKLRSIAGLWPSKDTIADTLDTIFEGQLSESVLKFVHAKCRPVWDPSWQLAQHGHRKHYPPNAVDSQELLGVSIRGTITKFTVLDYSAWELLKFVQDLCLRTRDVAGLAYSDQLLSEASVPEPKIVRHIDGDIIKRCIDARLMEVVLRTNVTRPGQEFVMSKFRKLVLGLHAGAIGDTIEDADYVEQAYSDLEYYLRPVL